MATTGTFQMHWKEISAEEAKSHSAYGFSGGLYIVYVLSILWTLHSVYIVFFDAEYTLAHLYGYENLTMVDFVSFVQILLTIPFLLLAPRLISVTPQVSVALFSVNWMVWFTFGMLVPSAVTVSLIVTLVTLYMVLYLMVSNRVNVTYLHRQRISFGSFFTI